MAYLNKYSPRVGTASYKLSGDVSWEEKKKREIILNKILKETALENNKKYIGKNVEVLVDKVDEDFVYGKTRSFKNVRIAVGSIVPKGYGALMQLKCDANAKRLHSPKGTMEPTNGEFIKVKIIKAKVWNLEGEVVK